mgnify:CR=1 FL=1
MKQKRTLIFLFSLCFFAVALSGCDGPAEEAGEEVDEAVQMQKEQLEDSQEEIAEAKARIEELKEDLAEARQERDQAKTRLEKSEQDRQRILKEIEQSTMGGDTTGTVEPYNEKSTDVQSKSPSTKDPQSMNDDDGTPADQQTKEKSESHSKNATT